MSWADPARWKRKGVLEIFGEIMDNRFDWEIGLEHNKKVLDTIDIKPYLTKGVDLRDVQDKLYDDYRHIIKDDPFMEEDLFNFMDRYDFMRYLKDRYKDIRINFWEEEHYEVM